MQHSVFSHIVGQRFCMDPYRIIDLQDQSLHQHFRGHASCRILTLLYMTFSKKYVLWYDIIAHTSTKYCDLQGLVKKFYLLLCNFLYTDSTTPLLRCPRSETAVSRDRGFIPLYFLNTKIAHNRTTNCVQSHIDCKNRMSRADVTVAPPIEGQIQWTLGEFVYTNTKRRRVQGMIDVVLLVVNSQMMTS